VQPELPLSLRSLVLDLRAGEVLALRVGEGLVAHIELVQKSGQRARLRLSALKTVQWTRQSAPVGLPGQEVSNCLR